MSPQDSGIPPSDPPAISLSYKDRSAGLIVFGTLTILLGVVAGLMSLLMIAAGSLAPKNPQVDVSMMLPAASIYVILGVALVWLGIGSIMARKWARGLLLIFSWGWLGIGAMAVIAMVFVMPGMIHNISQARAGAQPLPAGAEGFMMFFILLFEGIIFVVLPGIWVFFYSRPNVKATCEARDAKVRWTEACPLPVLGVALWLAISAPGMLLMALSGHIVLPFFGTFLSGAAGVAACVTLAGVSGYTAWLVYRLQPLGWWLAVAVLCGMMVSSMITFSRHDMMELYRLMNYSQAQLDQMEQTGLFTGNRMVWWMSLCMLPFLGYLLFVKKFFKRS